MIIKIIRSNVLTVIINCDYYKLNCSYIHKYIIKLKISHLENLCYAYNAIKLVAKVNDVTKVYNHIVNRMKIDKNIKLLKYFIFMNTYIIDVFEHLSLLSYKLLLHNNMIFSENYTSMLANYNYFDTIKYFYRDETIVNESDLNYAFERGNVKIAKFIYSKLDVNNDYF